MPTRIDTLVVGAGQAGLALSFHLGRAGHEHILLERGRLGQRWHERWDSLTLLSPNWINRLPGGKAHDAPAGFLDRLGFIAYLEDYARSLDAPVLEGVEVTVVERWGSGFHVDTSGGDWLARNVVVATGESDVPFVPFPVPGAVASFHSAQYRRADLLPDGPILVVGGGASGQQLAVELRGAGRDVVLSVGRHSRAPRMYRGRDIFEWVKVLGDLDRTIDEMPDVGAAMRVPPFPLTGANGGEYIGLDRLDSLGVAIAGRLEGFDGTRAVFAGDLGDNVAKADDRLGKLLPRIDAHPLAKGTVADVFPPVALPDGPRSLDVRKLGAVVWATGYRRSYPWLRVPGALDGDGNILHGRGVTRVPGLYVLGLAYQYRRSSHFIGGVGEDAAFLGELIGRNAVSSRAVA